MNKYGKSTKTSKRSNYVQVKNQINIVSEGNKWYFDLVNGDVVIATSKTFNSRVDVDRMINIFVSDFSLSLNNITINEIVIEQEKPKTYTQQTVSANKPKTTSTTNQNKPSSTKTEEVSNGRTSTTEVKKDRTKGKSNNS